MVRELDELPWFGLQKHNGLSWPTFFKRLFLLSYSTMLPVPGVEARIGYETIKIFILKNATMEKAFKSI